MSIHSPAVNSSQFGMKPKRLPSISTTFSCRAVSWVRRLSKCAVGGLYELLRHRTEFLHRVPRADGYLLEGVVCGHHDLEFSEREIRPSVREFEFHHSNNLISLVSLPNGIRAEVGVRLVECNRVPHRVDGVVEVVDGFIQLLAVLVFLPFVVA